MTSPDRNCSDCSSRPKKFPGQPEDFYAAIGEKSVRVGRPPRWLETLVRDLASANLFAEALAAAEALADFEPLWSEHWYDDLLAALPAAVPTEAIDEDRVRFQAQFVTDLCPGNPSVQMHAGDVYEALGERENALEAYQEARSLAVAQGDFEIRRAVTFRIADLTGDGAPTQQVIRVQRRVQPRRKRRH